MWRRVYAALPTLLVVGVLATHVQLGFERIRIRLVATPRLISDRSVSIAVPDVPGLTGKPAAIILRVKATGQPVTISAKFDGTLVARTTVQGQDEIRVDTSAPIAPYLEHKLVLESDRPGWQLSYVEVANVHGHSDGAVGFVIVPSTRRAEPLVPAWILVPIAAVLFAIASYGEWPRRPVWRRVAYGVAAPVGVLLLAVLVADSVSQFKILLSLKTFLIAGALLCFAFVKSAAIRLWPYRRFAPHAFVAWMFCCGMANYYEPGTGFTSLVAFGRQFEPQFTPGLQTAPHKIDPNSGYDGQFYAQLALDPLLTDEATVKALDDSAYRSRRVLLPAIAYVMGFGHPAWIVQAFALLNVIAWVLLAWLLLRWLPAGTPQATLAWTACMLGDSLLASVRRSLLDGPSLVFLMLGIIAIEENRRWLAAAICGLAGTARETNVLGGAILLPTERPGLKRIATLIAQVAIVVLPLAAWLADGQWKGLTPSPGGRSFLLPFVGYAQKWSTTMRDLHTGGWDSVRASACSRSSP